MAGVTQESDLVQARAWPLYQQVKRSIQAMIDDGTYGAGDYLPPEPALCETFGVSRITLRRAVTELSNEGRLKRIQGSGTVVLPRKYEQALMELSGFTDTMKNHEPEGSLLVLSVEPDARLPDAAQRLNLAADAPLVAVERLYSVAGRPLTLETLAFSAVNFADVLPSVARGGSFYESLRRHYDAEPAGADRLIEVVFPNSEDSTHLDISATEPVFRIFKTVLDANRKPISFSTLRMPCYSVSLHLSN